MLASETDIDDTARFMSQFGFGRKTGIDIEGELTGVLPSRDWKRQRFAGKQLPRRAPQVVPRATRSRPGIGQGYNAFTPMQLAQRDRDRRQRRRRLSGRTSSSTIANTRTGDERASSRREPTHTIPLKPEHLAVDQERAGRRQHGRAPARAAFAGAEYVSARQDRHRAGVLAQGREVRGAQGRRAAARPRLVHRLRAGRQAEDRARGAGRERRLRRAGRGADRAPGVRLLPARRAEGRARAGAAGGRRPTPRTRATDGRTSSPGSGRRSRAGSTASCSACALAIVGVGLVTLFSATDQSLARVDNQVVSLGVRAGADVARRQHPAADARARRGAAVRRSACCC